MLDDYAAKRIDAAALRSRVGWEDRWGYDYGFYGPTIDAIVAAGGALLALNAPRELTKAVSHNGLASLSAEEKKQLPELVLDDPAHRAWFDTLMEGMGGTSAHSKKTDDDEAPSSSPHDGPPMPSADQIDSVQVIWDETMADGAASWLAQHPTGHVVILAGNGHCHDSAIVNRIKRRGITSVVSVHPVLDQEGDVAEALVKPVNDYVLVLQLPPEAKAKAEAEAHQAK